MDDERLDVVVVKVYERASPDGQSLKGGTGVQRVQIPPWEWLLHLCAANNDLLQLIAPSERLQSFHNTGAPTSVKMDNGMIRD